MVDKNFRIRTATRTEVDIAIEWAAKEGWNPGLHDADCYYSEDQDGFFIGCIGNEPIATISAINYSNTFGFIGFYIVKPEYRGRGYGLQIWRAAFDHMKGLNVGLDSVVEQQETYERSGFKAAYRNIRYEGISGGKPPHGTEIRPLSTLPFETIAAYDQPFFPAARATFIQSWINQPDCTALGIMQDKKLAGYGVIRACRSGHKIGPLFADSPELAESLFMALKAGITNREPIYLDTPEVNGAAVSMAERYTMEKVFETARMYTDEEPDTPLHRVFGVTSFEAG